MLAVLWFLEPPPEGSSRGRNFMLAGLSLCKAFSQILWRLLKIQTSATSHLLRGPFQSSQIKYKHSLPLSIIPILKISETSLWDQLKIIQPMSLNLLVHFRYPIYFYKSLYEKPCCVVSLQLLTLLYSLHRLLNSEMLYFFSILWCLLCQSECKFHKGRDIVNLDLIYCHVFSS